MSPSLTTTTKAKSTENQIRLEKKTSEETPTWKEKEEKRKRVSAMLI